jgi:hypothetical protein
MSRHSSLSHPRDCSFLLLPVSGLSPNRAPPCVANAFLTVTFQLHIRSRYRQLVRSTFSRESRRRNTGRDRFGRAVFSCSGEILQARATALYISCTIGIAGEVSDNPTSQAVRNFRISRHLEQCGSVELVRTSTSALAIMRKLKTGTPGRWKTHGLSSERGLNGFHDLGMDIPRGLGNVDDNERDVILLRH